MIKTKWVSTSAWRGYEQPIFAVAGANDTGTWSDSPCPSNVGEKELAGFRKLLRKAKIKYKETTCPSSNVFCVHRYIVVSEADHPAALVLAEQYLSENETKLFYTCEVLKDQQPV